MVSGEQAVCSGLAWLGMRLEVELMGRPIALPSDVRMSSGSSSLQLGLCLERVLIPYVLLPKKDGIIISHALLLKQDSYNVRYEVRVVPGSVLYMQEGSWLCRG